MSRQESYHSGLEDDASLRVVIAYQDLPAGKRAIRMIRSVASVFGEELRFIPIPWSFDLVADADWRAVAASDAVQADILILATSERAPLPSEVRQWAESTIHRKQGTSAAVVALFGPENGLDSADSKRIQAIRQATQEAGLEFFAPTLEPAQEQEFARIHRRAEWVTPFLDEILHHDHCRTEAGDRSNPGTP